jgi:mannitol/fructose-specific phosphotransferase system IIA component
MRAEMTENTAAIREVLERLAERGYVDPDPALCPC